MTIITATTFVKAIEMNAELFEVIMWACLDGHAIEVGLI
jgi:hypothetical protein